MLVCVCLCANLQANTRYTFINLPFNMYVLLFFCICCLLFLFNTVKELPRSVNKYRMYSYSFLRYSNAKNESIANMHVYQCCLQFSLSVCMYGCVFVSVLQKVCT